MLLLIRRTFDRIQENEQLEAKLFAAEEAGMNGHIAKPLDIPGMKATLQHVLKNTAE